MAPQDTGFFNYSDYEHSTLRMLRLGVVASVKATEHLAVLGEVRSENGAHPEAYGLYLRVRPWSRRNFDILIGRVPPAFGAFSRQAYAADNPLIGYPVTYRYLTSLRPHSLPANADELLRMRGRGWLSNFSVGNTSSPSTAFRLASGFRWDTGVQVHAANDLIEGTAAVTTGTLSNPLVRDDNNGLQFAGRIALRPVTGLVVGGSLARGPFVSQAAARAALGDGANDDFTQTAWGADIEYSRDYYLVRFETIVSHWMLPIVAAPIVDCPWSRSGHLSKGGTKSSPGCTLRHAGITWASVSHRHTRA